jgi:chemosensory pili system protein ChpB (putative protein-glutamate methylesterase)
MLDVKHTQARIAILASSEQARQHLSTLLENVGLTVVVHDAASKRFLQQLEQSPADVLLVDLSDATDAEVGIIDTLLEFDSLPILFNDSSPAGDGANAQWAKKLTRKLANMVLHHKPEPLLETTAVATAPVDYCADKLQAHNSDINEQPEGVATNIWVLGASLGGPQAVRQFLAAVDPDLPVAFILAQHIGANHISLLAEQLDRVTQFKVLPGRSGHMLRHKEVVLAAAGKRINITDDGYLSLSNAAPNAIYSPSIDNVISAVAQRYGTGAGTIVFSGMGDDGARGCEIMAQHGGIIWAQDMDSCVISSMPDQARKTNTVTFSANPQALAERLYRYYCEEDG